MTIKRFETFIIIAIISAIGVAYALTQRPPGPLPSELAQNAQTQQTILPQPTPAPTEVQPVAQVPSSEISYQGEDGKDALSLLKASHRIETKEYPGVGEFVTVIDGIETDSKTNYWGFYVNGKQSPVGANAYITKNSDKLEWKVESIDQ